MSAFWDKDRINKNGRRNPYYERTSTSPQAYAASKIQQLRQSYNECRRAAQEFERKAKPSGDENRLVPELILGSQSLKASASGACSRLEQLTTAQVQHARDYRAFRLDRDLDRDAWIRDPLKAIFLVMILFFAEGGAAGAMMVMDGKMGVLSGFAYGWSFALLNIAIGLFAGFYCVRYAFRRPSEYPDPHDRIFRNLARFGIIGSAFTLAMLIFSAARTRATGSHIDIFNFAEITFLSTFNDGVALIIIALGVLGVVIAVIEGALGVSDFEPGFSELRKQAENQVQPQALECLEDTVDEILNRYDEIRDDYEDRVEQIQALANNVDDRRSEILNMFMLHNSLTLQYRDDVQLCIDKTACKEALPRERIANTIDLTAFDQLLLRLDQIEQQLESATIEIKSTEALNQLDQARDEAVNNVHVAYEKFQSKATFNAFTVESFTVTN